VSPGAPPPGAAPGARPRWRDVDGIVLLDKPAGLGSTPALQFVRRLLRAAKAGHAGTLDPPATGMLPLCFGQATKACGTLLGSAKAYRARLRLGVATDTGDADGRTLREQAVPALDPGAVEAVLAAQVGPGMQRPPMYAALKHQGRRLYELARRGETVERAPRQVTIHRMALVGLEAAEIEFDVVCSKGTYVRVLGEDIASTLGTVGHLAALRRVWVEPFVDAPMVELEAVERWALEDGDERPAWLLPVDAAFRGQARVDLSGTDALHLCQGRTPSIPWSGGDQRVSVYGPGDRFLGIASVDPQGRLKVVRLFVPGAGSGSGDSP
jgi:tRNA pseudouridine55 synthase